MPTHDMTANITCAGCKHAYADTALFCPNCGRPKVREAIGDTLLGKILGERFLVQELLGQGASGTIYKAEHVTLRRKVAIKVLHDELSRDDLAVERFRREATTVAEIDNEHIVEIHDFGRTPDGRLYLAMELLEGETLDGVLARERTLSVERAADILIQVGEALMEAHAIGYVHRDLRPRNIYLAVRRGKANFVKLLDFGLAKLVENDASAASTSLGMTFGDPRYMSPEQARGDRIDRRADIYQLGCVAYEMLTGAPPFSGSRVFDILTKQVTEAPQPLPTRRPGVPIWMEAAAAKMLAKDPENRFATTTRMVEALRRGLESGEVMEDEIARRRESIPPPSVSRVMQRMGIPLDQANPAPAPQLPPVVPQAPLPPLPPAAPPAPAMDSVLDPKATYRGAPPAPVVQKTPDSVELLRKRTGTPRVGVPITKPAPEPEPPVPPEEQKPVAGEIAPPPQRAKTPTAPPPPAVDELDEEDDAPPPPRRAKRTTRRPTGEPNISSAWYEEGERASEAADSERVHRARRTITPSTTDMSLYDDVPRRKRWPLLVVALGVVAAGGFALALAVSGGNESSSKKKPAAPQAAVEPSAAAALADAAPSQVIDPVDAAEAPPAPPPAAPAAPTAPAVAAKTEPKQHTSTTPTTTGTRPTSTRPTGGGTGEFVAPGGGDPSARRPGGGGGTTTPVTTPPPPPPPPTSTPDAGVAGPSGTDNPIDPYGGGEPPDTAPPEKRAEFYAAQGQQQLGSGDTASAAASFKKANELDAKNVVAVIGMGEIALRQGLFGDAIAHLRKAAKLAPRSSRVFTLLGEAFLSSGNNSDALANFKKALQLDPDNARAREGFNEASSRTPPPGD
jgi:serine/threonine protein kinase